MKKILVSLLAAATVGGAFAQSSFPDVPENHWAGGAVDRIADLGIVIGFPDGTFRGNEAFTRYQSALVVSRLLDVIGEELDARQALTDADLAALANALQDLAGTVADHDAAIAAIGDDVAVNSARLDALEGLDDQDLLNQLEALRAAVDTAAAQAAAAEDLANSARGAANAAANRAAENADAIAALSWFANDLESRVKALEDRPVGSADEGLASRLSVAENDIANIREFVILIRRDQVAMRGQLAALEDTVEGHGADIADLQDRVAELEKNQITFDGTITVSYRVDRMSGDGTPFDVDRAYGVGLPRDQTDSSVFSTGVNTNLPANDRERDAEHRHDIGGFDKDVTADIKLNVGFNRNFDGQGSPGALNDFEGVADIQLRSATGLVDEAGDSYTGYTFALKSFSGTFSPIGNAPLTFEFGEAISVNFTPYVLNQVSTNTYKVPGFVATLENPVGFLDFIDPTLTVAYIAPDGGNEVYRGARLTLDPLAGVTIGGSFVQHATSTSDKDDVLGDNSETTVWGVDASAAISIFSLEGEFASSSHYDTATATSTDNGNVVWVKAEVDGTDIPVLDSLSANYRSIPAGWDHAGSNYGLNSTKDNFVFQTDQTGFGVDASLGLWVVDVDAYFNSYSTSVLAAGSSDEANIMAFGVDVSAELFRAISLTGFFHSASVDGTVADSTRHPYDENDAPLTAGATRVDRDGNLNTGFGVGLEHDGSADNALVAGLNFDASYSQLEADFGRSVIAANADYTLDLSFVTATPYVGFVSKNSDNAAGRPYEDYNVSQISAGLGLETSEFDFFLKPSLVGAVNYRSANYTDNGGADLGASGDFTADEFQFSVGLSLNEFLFDNSVLTVRYGSWQGTNLNTAIGSHSGSNASLIHVGDRHNGVEQFVNGWEAIWNYSDLQFAYGVYHSNDGNVRDSAGQVFSIKYSVDF